LCLSTLAAGFAIREGRDKELRFLCFFHAALALSTLAAPIINGIFRSSGSQPNDASSYVLLFWCVIFTPLASFFARYFRRNR
jgi:O-antigen/teichoic acid export membrane protein